MRRCIELDIHRDFAQLAVWEAGQVGHAGRGATTPEALRLFAESPTPTDDIALEATANTYAIATLLRQRMARGRQRPHPSAT
jgi:transposase